MKALLTLRSVANKFWENFEPDLKDLSFLLFCDHTRFLNITKWDKNVSNGRPKLLLRIQQYLGHDTMLLPDRLVNLITQAVCYQSKKSNHHINYSLQLPYDISILEDYQYLAIN